MDNNNISLYRERERDENKTSQAYYSRYCSIDK